MRKFRNLDQLLRNVDCVKVKVHAILPQKRKHFIKQERVELASIVKALRDISSLKRAARIHADEVSIEGFRRCFEKPRIPVIISEPYWKISSSKMQSCPAIVRLLNFLKWFKNDQLECGEDIDGYSLEVKLKDFLIYSRRFDDKFPLYIFDSSVTHWKVASRKSSIISTFFTPPKFFKQDYMECVGLKDIVHHGNGC